jgi:hypothetical protein
MRGRVGQLRQRAHQRRKALDLWAPAADGELDRLVDAERAGDRRPRAQPLPAALLVEGRAGERDPLPQQAVFAELRERMDGTLGARAVPGGPERDVEAAVQGPAQKPTLCSCEASET